MGSREESFKILIFPCTLVIDKGITSNAMSQRNLKRNSNQKVFNVLCVVVTLGCLVVVVGSETWQKSNRILLLTKHVEQILLAVTVHPTTVKQLDKTAKCYK